MIITEDVVHEQWFKEMVPENQEDTLKHLYFEAIAVFRTI